MVQKHVGLHAAFDFFEIRPWKQRQAQIDGRGVQHVDGILQADTEASLQYSLRARRMSKAAKSSQMLPSRPSLASASVERLTGERKPMLCSFVWFASKQVSMSRRLSR
jgi:hypothetical protein